MIGINGRFLTRRVTGVERYAERLVEHMFSVAGQQHLRVYVPRELQAREIRNWLPSECVRIVPAGKGEQWFEQYQFPRQASGDGCTVLLHPANTLSTLCGLKQITLLFDSAPLLYPSNYTFLYRLKFRLTLLNAQRRSVVVLTASNTSAAGLRGVLGKKDIGVLPSGPGLSPQAGSDMGLGYRYALAYGSADPRKQLNALAQEWGTEKLSNVLELVVVSSLGGPLRGEKPLLLGGEIGLDYVDDRTLAGLIKGAEVVVYPSKYEGTAMAPMEALMCGARVLVTDIPVYREQLGDRATYMSPTLSDLSSSLMRSLEKPRVGFSGDHLWRMAAEQICQIAGLRLSDGIV